MLTLQMMKNNIHTLIIPDIHGRTFWKNDIKKFPISEYPDLKIIFLGDYLDPYEFENISKIETITNFEEIIRTAKADNRITLLLGNHDYHYIHMDDHSRIDYDHFQEIKRLIEDNLNLFKIAYEEVVNNMRYLYTHAGITTNWFRHLNFIGNSCINNKHLSQERKEWIKQHLYKFKLTADNLNSFLYNIQGMAILHEISYERGGEFQNGSCIWSDIVEHLYSDNYFEDIFQIFGHSLRYPSIDEGYIDYENNFAMLDSRCSWVLYDDGKIKKLN